MRRRRLLQYAGCSLVGLVPVPLTADVAQVLRAAYGERSLNVGRVNVSMPALAENGNSVPLTVEVQSPMLETDFVREIRIFAEKNPIASVANFGLTPATGRAKVATRIRLSDSQVITAVAEMNDGSLWTGSAETIVTLAACIDPLL